MVERREPIPEALRDQIRAEGRVLVESMEPLLRAVFPTGPDGPADPTALAALRAACEISGTDQLNAHDFTLETTAGPLRLRALVPEEPVAVLLDLHGGGGVYGAPEMNDRRNERLVRSLGIAVLGVHYRLAPEHPPSAALDDCLAAARWLVEHGPVRYGTTRMLIGGDSWGAALAAMTMIALREADADAEQYGFEACVLECGLFDLSRTPSQRLGGTLGPDPLGGDLGAAFLSLLWPETTPEQLREPGRSVLYASLRRSAAGAVCLRHGRRPDRRHTVHGCSLATCRQPRHRCASIQTRRTGRPDCLSWRTDTWPSCRAGWTRRSGEPASKVRHRRRDRATIHLSRRRSAWSTSSGAVRSLLLASASRAAPSALWAMA